MQLKVTDCPLVYEPALVWHFEVEGEMGSRGLPISARTLLAEESVHLKSALKLI